MATPIRLNRSLTELERNTLHTLREMRLLLYELRPADLERGGPDPGHRAAAERGRAPR